MSDLQRLGTLADINLGEAWTAMMRTGTTESFGPLRLCASGIQMAFFNGAYLTGPADDPDGCIQHAMDFMATAGVPWLLWVRAGVDDALLAAGRAAGLRDAGGPPAMGMLPLAPTPPAPPELEIDLVTDPAGLAVHRDLVGRAFGMPSELVASLMVDELLTDPSLAFVVGRVGGEPVSTAMVCTTGTTAGIYNVATPAEHQRKGYGAALTWAAIDAGRATGCDHTILQASPAGRPVYEAMGYVHLGDYVQLEGPPA